MADTKISDLVELGGASLDDLLVIVDVDDTSMATSGTNKKIKAGNATGLLAPLAGGEVSVTGAATATESRMHACSGTTANYTVTLPPASGNLGKLIGFRMAAALTKLVTLDGNASETIDGALTLILAATESVVLLCDGSGWATLAQRRRAMNCKLVATGAQTGLTSGGFTKLSVPSVSIDVGGMADAANSKVVIRRDGNYQVGVYGTLVGLQDTHTMILSVYKNGSEFARVYRASAGTSTSANAFGAGMLPLAAGDYVEAYMYYDGTASDTEYQNPAVKCSLSVTEVLQ